MIDGDDVVREVVLAAPREAVWEMFVDAERLVRWIGLSADVDPVPGGRFRFEVVPGQFCEGAYVTLDRPSHLTLAWGLLHDDDQRLLHDDGWARFLGRLAPACAGAEPSGYPDGDPAARLAALREERA